MKRLGERLSRKNPLADGYGELLKNYDALQSDCALLGRGWGTKLIPV